MFFQKAIKISPDYSLSYKYLGNIFEQTRDLVNALKKLGNLCNKKRRK